MTVALALWWPLVSAAQPTPPAFDHRRLIAENLQKLFSKESQVRNVAVSELRQMPSPTGLMWGACVRVSATGVSGQPTAPRTYVVTFLRNTVAERRQAAGNDCAGVQFRPLG